MLNTYLVLIFLLMEMMMRRAAPKCRAAAGREVIM